LHHGAVAVFDRGEDEAEILETRARDDGSVLVHRVPAYGSENPSARRHGLAIGFECEDCTYRGELTVAQHKGATLVGWRRI
jgi:hypothetical protein